ncbi:MAG: four helix bundle protein [Flavobacterium sp.]|nr:MAG: four helix bundle protein [Flavobacterium sp.]
MKKLPRTIQTIEDGKQLVRSSGSVGANYIEANESLSKKDFCYRVKICRKEAKESIYWLTLLKLCYPEYDTILDLLFRKVQS